MGDYRLDPDDILEQRIIDAVKRINRAQRVYMPFRKAKLGSRKRAFYDTFVAHDKIIDVGSRSIFKNPYPLTRYSKEESIRLYKEHVKNDKRIQDNLHLLRGKALNCAIKKDEDFCHAQYLADLVNEMFGD